MARKLGDKIKRLCVTGLASAALAFSYGCGSVKDYAVNRSMDFVDGFKGNIGLTRLNVGARAKLTDAFEVAVGAGEDTPLGIGFDGRKTWMGENKDSQIYIGLPFIPLRGLVNRLVYSNDIPFSYFLATYHEGDHAKISPHTEIIVPSREYKDKLLAGISTQRIDMMTYLLKKRERDVRRDLYNKIKVVEGEGPKIINREKYKVFGIGQVNEFEGDLDDDFIGNHLIDLFFSPESDNFFKAKYKRSVPLPKKELEDKLDCQVGVDLLLLRGECGVDLYELADFVTGLIPGIDIAKDDK